MSEARRDEWIEGRFVGVCAGDRVRGESGETGDPPGARRFQFEIESGTLRDFARVPEPPATAPREEVIRQDRVKRVELLLCEGEAGHGPRQRPLFDVRIRDWKLMHPAESKGRAYGTIVGTLQARLAPPQRADDDFVAPRPPPHELDVEAERTEPERAEPERAEPDRAEPVNVPELRLEKPAIRTSTAPAGGASEVLGTEGDVVYARLRWGLATLVLCVGTVAFALGCGAHAAITWATPLVLALLLRLATRGVTVGTSALHGWLGLALVLGQAVGYADPLLGWWQLGCGVAAVATLPWLGAPVVVSGMVQLRWPFCLAATAWTLLVCASCWQLDGGCAAPGSRAGSAVAEAQAGIRHVAPPRTTPGGRWPAAPASGGRPQAFEESGGSSAQPSPSTQPSSSPSTPARSFGSWPSTGRPSAGQPSTDQPASAPPAGGAPADSPESDGGAAYGGFYPGSEARAASEFRSFSGRSPRPGGWVSAQDERARPRLSRISVEHANRNPNVFFGGDTAAPRVYMPTDGIFQNGSAQLRDRGGLELSRLANLLALHPERRVRLEVHTDSNGTPSHQQELSERRAAAIHEWLTDRGHLVDDQLEVRGKGGSEPLVPPDGSHAAQEPNRRLEVLRLE